MENSRDPIATRIMSSLGCNIPMSSDRAEPRLTSLSHGGGCGCKIAPGVLAELLKDMPAGGSYPDLLVGSETSDDAAVFRLNESQAIVSTTDFFTPIVDDPFDFGRIAATNALSDIYAMGGTPITALNIAAFPIETLDEGILRRILEGGVVVATAAGVVILGGHTVKDEEPKYGMAVTGTIHPGRVISNAGARPGDYLLLTKPIGAGILTTARRRDG